MVVGIDPTTTVEVQVGSDAGVSPPTSADGYGEHPELERDDGGDDLFDVRRRAEHEACPAGASIGCEVPGVEATSRETGPPGHRDAATDDRVESATRHSTEDADAFRVRATYARLEAEGVPGDGWLEGVERTRTRVVSAASAAVLEATKGAGNKGADVGAEEEARLRATDRYGFFTQPTKHEGRLALLAAAPLGTFTSPHKPTHIPLPTTLPPVQSISSIPPPRVDPKEHTRISKWARMLLPASAPGSGGAGVGPAWRWDPRKARKRAERVFKGIPDRWRSAAWGTLVDEPRGTQRLSIIQLGARYRDLVDAPSEHDVQIDLDVPRTISGHVMFHTRYGQGQRSLFYVLHAFAQLCPSCGYVQGMGPIAATLLNYFEPERTYAILVRLHDEYAMHSIFQPGFPGLLESIYVQERLVERIMPAVYHALSKHMISSTSFVTKWYITLFANTVPFQTQLRLWDAFLLEGRDVLVVAAVAVLWILKANFETILSLLSSTFVPEDDDALLRWMQRLLTDRQLRAEMDQWRAEWARLVAEGKSAKALEMKYASVIVPLVVVGVMFLVGCVWVATRDKDDADDEESVRGDAPAPMTAKPNPLDPPRPAHTHSNATVRYGDTPPQYSQ
ncbi:Rab-GTPase-TBC domain containing protein [Ceratobasidium theobromae]|uniref:Rab-GTPase-TBC domain containing protein n=1 Tax=Ceratobasidium theobromae TaxID=1582974 RepID=A0A5N5Q8Y0_9AGAM|nr:Rab-GTPase-TBC domain containing protein [Ceratobasidium theobromae]